MKADKINKIAKINIYYLILFWAVGELVESNIIFGDRSIISKLVVTCTIVRRRKLRESKKIQTLTKGYLTKVNEFSKYIDWLSFEILVYISLNYLVVESEDLKLNYISKDYIINMLETIKSKHKIELQQHYKLFDFIDYYIK